MSPSEPAPYVPRDAKTPRIYGTLNIVFGSLLLLCNLGYGAMYVAAPTLRKAVESWQVQLKANIDRQQASRVAQLQEREAAATTEADKARAKADLDAFRAQPTPDISAMSMGFKAIDDRRIWWYGMIEVGTGLVLNTLLIVAGTGLLSLKDWGRRWSLGLAAIKLARLAALVAFSIAVVIPAQVKTMEGPMEKMRAQVQAGPAGPNAAAAMTMSPQALAAMSTAGVVLNAIAATVYPILLLVMLTRPKVKAACSAAKPTLPEMPW